MMFRAAALAVLLASLVLIGVRHAPPLSIRDDFEDVLLDPEIWSTIQLRAERGRMQAQVVRMGQRALAIDVGEKDRDCDGECQRNEIRIHNDLRLLFGADAWYGFSFRMEGDVPHSGGIRWVIGQWKQETDASPFVAQRYNDGIFHITVQDGACRRLLATSRAADRQLVQAVSFAVARGTFQRLAAGPLNFLSDKAFYDCDAGIAVELGAPLPDPYRNWVDMIYHIRGSLDGSGIVEIWANGTFIARAAGRIGAVPTAGPTQYFKIGQYRDLMPGRATIYVDNFRRGASYREVDPSLPLPQPER
ncbi:heparin lyase I family protein [Rhodoligotrophos ferricapiens]|uniref:heparin lyase I family protein n=1 Tax=Rhodoligotrophos ferricapiens TaxID=3069264 RepID=UPI00315CC1C9